MHVVNGRWEDALALSIVRDLSTIDRAPRLTKGHPFMEAENEVRSVADRLLMLETFLAGNRGGLSAAEVRAVDRLVGDAASDARAVELAWDLTRDLARAVPTTAAAAVDPIFGAIDAHRAAVSVSEAADVDEADDPPIIAALVATEEAMKSTVPTTPACLRALIEYTEERHSGDYAIETEYFPAILAGCRAVLPHTRCRADGSV